MHYNKRTIGVVTILFVVVIVLGFLTYSFISPNGLFSGLPNDLKALQSESSAPYTDLDGNAVDLSVYKGKPLIINSWASWIPFSQTELPLLAQLKGVYGDQITVIAINRMENLGIIKAFMSTFAIPNSIVFLADPTDNFYKVIQGYAMPETMFYDVEGNSIAHVRGVLSETEAKMYIEAMIASE